MKDILIIKGQIVNEGKIFMAELHIRNGKIKKIILPGDQYTCPGCEIIDAKGKWILPGIIDDQVHFREPGLTHKADIGSESAAAVAGGITSFMEMPNTNPQTVTLDLLEQKHELAAAKSLANFSFYLGATNDNLAVIKKLDPKKSCGVKVFMGSSTGNMLVDNPKTLEGIFAESPIVIATHCEDEGTIQTNLASCKDKYGENVPISMHPEIRSEKACFLSSSLAVKLARKYNSRLHVLHLSTLRELDLFDPVPYTKDKRITAEVCVHHLWFDSSQYEMLGTHIKWNPAIKTAADREGLMNGLLSDQLDVVATDHAPHTLEEKSNKYFKAPSGGPLVQHSLLIMLEFYHRKYITLEKIVQKMCHTPAELFDIDRRGYIREGYWADLVIVDPESPWTVKKENIKYKCGWSPLLNQTFQSSVTYTLVNGHVVYENTAGDPGQDKINPDIRGARLQFTR
jgi:dihydroorotase